MKRKTVFKTGFLLFLYMGVVILMPSTQGLPIAAEPQAEKDFSVAAGENWLDGWNYRKQIDIMGTDAGVPLAGQDHHNYQIELDVNYGSGSDSGNSVYLNSHSQIDFDDVRFTDDDGITELDYYRLEYTASVDSEFWVEVADDLNGNQTIFIYYGNDTVSTTSNGTDTFIFFDDFEDNDLNEWTVNTGCSITSTSTFVHTGTYACSVPDTGVFLQKNLTSIEYPILVHAQMFDVNSYRGLQLRVASTNYTDVTIAARLYESSTSKVYYYSNGYVAWSGCADAYNAYTYYEYEVGFNQDYDTTSKMQLFMEGSYIGEEDHVEGDGTPYEVEDIGQIRVVGQSSYQSYFDDYWIRKWWEPDEPSIAEFGDEESDSQWQVLNTASVTIWLGMSEATQWAFDNIIALIGLAMFVSSGVYLVYGGRKKLSIEKIFVAMCLFSVGLGIFIGSIVP